MNKKIALFVLIISSLALCSMLLISDRIVSGIVTNERGEALIGATVLIKGTDVGTVTNIDGEFSLEIPDGSSTLIISYTGYETQYVEIGATLRYNIQLKEVSEALSEVIVTGYSSGKKKPGKESKSSESFDDFDFAPALDKPLSSSTYTSGITEEMGSSHKRADITHGTLTAGEWNDLNNWEDWKSLLSNKDFKDMESYWKFGMKNRYSVFLTNKYELPIVDAVVSLLDATGHTLWEAKTDNSGKAELWREIFIDKKAEGNPSIEIEYLGKHYSISNPIRFEGGVNHLQINEECSSPKNVDIMFVVDATGSMGDEIEYLKIELEDVVNRAKSINKDMDLRLGSVFYRDHGDEYVTRESPLDKNIDKTINFIRSNTAGGGGDYPEAVHEGLRKAIYQDWSDEAMARIIFLLLDAPPHHEEKILNEMHDQLEEAARMGIKVIPITASGINRQTEFLMKFFSLGTNGTYVFLTDHSGIGEKHLAPLVEDYEVEKLNDLLVRLIANFAKSNGCQENQQTQTSLANVKLYPNPTSNYVNIQLEDEIDRLYVRSSSGMVVHSRNKVPAGETRIDLENMVDGVYTVQFLDEGTSTSKQLILIK